MFTNKLNYRRKNYNGIKEYSDNYIQDYLISLGIHKTESFTNQKPDKRDEEHYSKLDNYKEVVEELHYGFENNKKFFLIVDSDTDGYTSSAIFYSFFKALYPNADITYHIHEGKEHGVFVDTVPIDADYVILPDAGSNQYTEQEELSNKGYKVIILDHHNLDTTYPRFPGVWIVNNQSSTNFNNKELTGAGVVYKIIWAFNETYSYKFPLIWENYADLAALGLIADMADTRQLDTNYIIRKGLATITNPMFMSLLSRQSFSIKDIANPTKIDVAFYIAPLINGVIRFGNQEEKVGLFHGFITYNSTEKVVTTYRGNLREESVYDYAARLSANARARQNKEKEKCMEFLSARIESQKLHENQLIAVVASKDDKIVVPQTLTGLVAMELLKKYKKPILVLRPKTEDGKLYYMGSGRGKPNKDFTSFQGFLKESGICEFVEGHDNAFGCSIEAVKLPNLITYANDHLSHIEFSTDDYEVDYIFDSVAKISSKMLSEFGGAINIYGNGIPQPKFAFEISIFPYQIQLIGGDQTTVKFSINGVDFIKFKDKELATLIRESYCDMFKFRLVGRAQINQWYEKITPQIIIDEIEVEETKIEKLF